MLHGKLKSKVNVCSLMCESKIIRRQERQLKKRRRTPRVQATMNSLQSHRRWVVRNESRAAQLIYAFQRKVPYLTVEPTADHDNYKWHDTLARIKRKNVANFDDICTWIVEGKLAKAG